MSATSRNSEILALPNAVWGSLGQGFRFHDVYGRSAVVGERLCAKVIKVCKSWGEVPQRLPEQGSFFQEQGSFFQVPVDSSERSPGMPGGVLAIAMTLRGVDPFKRPGAPFFHAVFLSDEDYAELQHQAYGLWACSAFMKEWNGKTTLPFVEVATASAQPPPLSEITSAQATTLGSELDHILRGGSISYTAFAPQHELCEHLRTLQLGLPIVLRRTLGFSVFLGDGAVVGGVGPYAIGAVHGVGKFALGRSTRIDHHHRAAGNNAAIGEYVKRYVDALHRRHLDDLLDLGRCGL